MSNIQERALAVLKLGNDDLTNQLSGLDLADASIELEKEFDVEISDEALDDISTVKELIDAFQALFSG